MEFQRGSGGNNSGDDETSNASSRKEKKSYHRHTVQQIASLETFFKECPHPDENQRRQLSRELVMDPKQIKFWFQNKRTQTKTQIERADNSALRAENEKIQCENFAIKEALKNVICPSCGGPPFGEEGRLRNLQKLQLENAHLREEHENVAGLLAKYIGRPIEGLMPGIGSTVDLPPFHIPDIFASPAPDIDMISRTSENIRIPYRVKPLSEMEKAIMAETVANATDELIKLAGTDEPFWIKSPNNEKKYVINLDSIEKIFPRISHFKSPNARTESSKDSAIIPMNAFQLVEMILDADKWLNFFPTTVTKAKTIHVVEAGNPANKNGCLLLMHQQLHILSPLVPLREFYVLRHCQVLEMGLWVIVDVSYDWPNLVKEDDPSTTRAWKLPSGCMIQDLSNGSTRVTWVEHVEVDDKTQTHRLYRDLICGTSSTAYGAQRWICNLQRMCEKFTFAVMDPPPSQDIGGVITTGQGRKTVMKLSHRMVKNFSGSLSMSGKLNFPQLSEVNNSGVRVSVRKTSDPGQPNGTVVTAATSLWLPLPAETVFNFFKDVNMRAKWDVLCNGNPAQQLANVTNGSHPGNCLKILRPLVPMDNNLLMLQESYVDSLGYMVIYAPFDIPSMNKAISGGDFRLIPILPSGFVITNDGRREIGAGGASTSSTANSISNEGGGSSGSLLTVAFQILVSSPMSPNELNMETVATVHTLISSTVQRIKASLNCSNIN